MSKAGLVNISFGVESGDQEVLNKINKKVKLESYFHATKWAHKWGIKVRYLLMVGLSYQDERSIDKTIDFLRYAKPDDIMCHYFTPYPGSEIAMNLNKYGITVLPHTMEQLRMRDEVIIKTKWLSKEQILNAKKKILQKFNEIITMQKR